ncbi:cadherin-like protein 26 isoform X1 [Cyprinodon tularosa]|uniref:cadherin-like protein 26 isoform X1 n=1 Tax=Cyprinodon tularosa TaxID=77115 RepID=UPI0018E2428A|nr:cadherin-like protein 26 isoform X1 [Cyprinodon tularosa]
MLLFTLLILVVQTVTCSEVHSRQKRDWIIDSYEMEEGHPGPFPYSLGKVDLNSKYQVFFDLHGEGVDKEPKDVFFIEKNSGEIFVKKAVDYEKHKVLKLTFEAKKSLDFTVDTRLGIEIIIHDINDNPPVFEKSLYEITVDEDASQGSHIHTVLAYDEDKSGTPNSTFHYAIKSVSPETSNIEFFIKETGALYFKGCFDHEVASRYTLLVEAIDHGEVVRLSSSTTVIVNVEDGNNHLPVFTGQTGSGKVKERETGFSPLRLHVTDEDVFQSKAWRARYSIQGDEEGHFKIETDTKTNDGVLTVVKGLDFKKGPKRELKIFVKNEAEFFSCKVKSRPSTGLWNVDITNEQSGGGEIPYNAKEVVIEVLDVNDPPEFDVTVKEASVKEDAPIGTWVEKVTAVDPDNTTSRDFIYKIGHDPAGWMKIDAQTGNITTKKLVDRESSHVVNNIYTLIVQAVDNGKPPMTGTATLHIHLIDVNDNVPQLDMNNLEICLSDGQTTSNISATDLDETPYGGPFTFELVGDVRGKWKLDPSYGFTAGLVRDSRVYAGVYSLKVKVSDMQGQYGIYRLTTTVCSCSVARNCRNRSAPTFNAGGAVGIALLSLLLFAVALLAAISFSCKENFTDMDTVSPVGNIQNSNIENPGTDCKVPNNPSTSDGQTNKNSLKTEKKWDWTKSVYFNDTNVSLLHNQSEDYRRKYYWNWSKIAKSIHSTSDGQRNNSLKTEEKVDWMQNKYINYRKWEFYKYRQQLLEEWMPSQIHLKVRSFQETEDDLPEYKPHIYAEEGDADIVSDLDSIIIPDNASFDELEDLGLEFQELASICMSAQMQIKSKNTKTIYMHHGI